MYVFLTDFDKIIQSENLKQIINSDTSILEQSILAAEEEIWSYLTTKYDLTYDLLESEIYNPTSTYDAAQSVQLSATTFSSSVVYHANDIVNYNGDIYLSTGTTVTGATPLNWANLGIQNQIFYAKLPAPRFDYDTEYVAGDRVFYQNKIYTALRSSINSFPDSTWSAQTYVVSGLTTDTTVYESKDLRSQKIIGVILDIAIYNLLSRVSPRNIPEMRVLRNDNAIKWLKMLMNGEISQMNLVKRTPRQGNRFKLYSEGKNINKY